jgi:hypothetical protein
MGICVIDAKKPLNPFENVKTHAFNPFKNVKT